MASFPTTRWTLIRHVSSSPTPESRRAMESLCRQYAAPVLGFVRHRVRSREKAEDIAQGFFAQLIENNLIGRADRERGRFRTFLLHALRGYLADVGDYDRAIKRGGDRRIVSLDGVGLMEPRHEITADRQFELQWVRTLLAHSVAQLERECAEANKTQLFQALRRFLDQSGAGVLKDVAVDLNMSEAAVRVALHRLRKQLGRIIRSEIADTVDSATDVDDELARLLQIVETQS